MPKLSSSGLTFLPRRIKPVIRVRGRVNDHTGYGLHLQYTVRHLLELGYQVETVPVEEVSGAMPEVVKTLRPAPSDHRRELLILPAEYKAAAHQWMFTMFETTQLPPRMVRNIEHAHALIVPSKWSAQCFNAQGLAAPIHVVPLGYNEHLFFPARPENGRDRFVIGTAGNPSVSVAVRKNMEAVVEAFILAFPCETDVVLRIKVLPECLLSQRGDPRIDIIRGVLSEQELAIWMQSLDVFATAARGEAFGFFNIQAMACGVPVISPNFGGVSDYFSDAVGYPVDYALVRPHGQYYGTGLWAEPSIPSLIQQMRRAYKQRLELREKACAAIDRASAYTWRKCVEKLEDALQASRFWDLPPPIHTDSVEDRLRKFYRVAAPQVKGPVPDLSEKALSNTPRGLGDTLIFSHLPKAAAVQGKVRFIHAHPEEHRHFKTLMSFNQYYLPKPDHYGVVYADVLQREVDMGHGHFIQRLQRAFGLEPVLKPQPYLYHVPLSPSARRVVLHFEAGGPHGGWQKINLHPRARILYEEGRSLLQEFINQHPELEFIQLGKNPVPWQRVNNWTESTLEETIQLIASAGWFIGIMSGPLHIAAAFGLKSIVIVNFPPAHKILLPTLVDIDQVESEWFYPQNVHLHQETEGPLVPRLSRRTLEMAFNGEIYPFWSDRYLSLIQERL